MREQREADRARQREKEHEAQTFGQRTAKGRCHAFGGEAGEHRQRDGGDGNTEEAERKLLEALRIGQPGERGFLARCVGGEDGIEQHRHLRAAGGEHRRPHQMQDFLHRRVFAAEVEAETETDAMQCGKLNREL